MNYEIFFALKDKPFRQSPDTEYFFSSNVHKELMHHLFYCIEADDAFVEITGEPGIGKTITIRSFLNQTAGDKVRISLILNPKITPQDLLVSIALDCGMDENIIDKYSGEKLFRLFHQHLEKLNQNSIVPIVIIDDAHSMSNESLEYLCLISNLETDKKSLIKIILLGQPLLRQRLQDPVLQKIENRISIRYYLTPLSKHDMANYIYHRLGIASESGTPPSIFSEHIVNQIYKYSKGVPRLVNMICDRTLMAAFSENTREIQAIHVKKAYRSFHDNQKTSRHIKKKRFLVVSIALLFLISCIYMISGLINRSTTPETQTDLPVPNQTMILTQQSEKTVTNASMLTQTNVQKETKMASSKKSNQKQTEKAIQMPPERIEQSSRQSVQSIQSVNVDKLPMNKLFTKNSYCIVVSPEINRMIVWQGKPDFSGLTPTPSKDSFQLEEGVYFLNDHQPEHTYTKTTVEPLSSTQNTTTPRPLTSTHNIAMRHQSLTSEQNVISEKTTRSAELTQNVLSEENKKSEGPTHATIQTNHQKTFASNNAIQLQHSKKAKSLTVSTKENVSAQKDELHAKENTKVQPKDQTQKVQQSASKIKNQKQKEQHAASKIKDPIPQTNQQKTTQSDVQLQDKKKQHNETQNIVLKEVLLLPSDKRMALISKDVKQLTVWKGTNDQPRLIKQEKMEFTGPEGIYILCKNKNKPILFNPQATKQLSGAFIHEIWEKIDPITNVTPIIVLRSHQKKYGAHTRKLTSFVNRWEAAWHQKNLDAFMKMYVNDLIYFYKLNAQPIKLNWKILKSSQSRIFSGNRQKIMHISPVTYLLDPGNSNFAIALFNQTFSDANYSEIGVMIFYLKYEKIEGTNQKDWHIYGRLRIY